MPERLNAVKGAQDHLRLSSGAGGNSGRRTLPEAAAFWIVAVLFLMLFFASAAAGHCRKRPRSGSWLCCS